ncbi:leucine-rich repeat domain-containing protein [Mycoplasma hominis]|uniref:leucine-rich repeat domain-containing protein n=1 Tax=Metamycoplasma hominis TaxID=2098 RepID=UPI001F291AAE|nr:leucine-rich repeat domain-containing protein [Metamycoplasma hominis]MCF1354849.1 leucine-rich repeat domain-containing protein [Metamycoplasma hominis]
MKNKKNSKIWLILSSISALTAIFPLVAISCDYKVKQNSKENKEDLKPDENKPEPKPENPTKEDDSKPDENKPKPKPENPTKEEDSSNLNKKFKFELTKSNTWKITKFIGNDSKVTIPREYQGKNITEIGNRAFFNSVIQSVTIPGSVKEIGESAFSGCRNIKEVFLNEGLEKIGSEAFKYTNIESITIPGSIKEIDKGAFSWCTNLKEVILNEGLEKIGAGAFNYTRIESINIPGSVKEIGGSAFSWCENLKEVILNEGLEKIGAFAFYDTNIESITIPDSIKEIGKGALYIWNIRSIFINPNNKNFEINDNFFIDKNNKKILEYLDKKTTKVTIPGSVKEIGEWAFSDCKYLREVILNEGLEKIGTGVFSNTNIESISIPGSVKEIGESAFSGCWNLKKVIYKGDASNINRWLNIGIDKTKIKIIPSNN